MKQTDIHFPSYLAQFFLEWKTLQTKVVQKLETDFLCPKTDLKNRAFYETMWKHTAELGNHRWHGACALHAR